MTTLVLITGTGRSGTSTMSGTFHHLGLHVPGPHLGADESNPKGFFESRWAVRFHKELLARAGINDFDSRPDAIDLAQRAVTDELRARLRGFLEQKSEGHDQIVVKDPRSVWAQRLWREQAAEVGLDIRYVSMLRHPAEVIGSRSTYYANRKDEAAQRSYETFSVARWINGSVVSERETRGERRAFVAYEDLLTDWRQVLVRLASDLDLTYDVDVAGGAASPVDDFIDPDLRRHRVTWAELRAPETLTAIAERVWADLRTLERAHGADASASADLDALAEVYAEVFTTSVDIAHDAVESERRQILDKARKQPGAVESSAPGSARRPPAPSGRTTVDDMPVGEVGGRDLVKVIAARARRKLRRG